MVEAARLEDGAEVVVLSHDPGSIPSLTFKFPTREHAVETAFGCAMDRVAGRPPAQASAQPSPPSGPSNSVLKFQVRVAGPGYFTPLARAQLWITPGNPEAALTKAGFTTTAPNAPLSDRLAADCRRSREDCARDRRAITAML